MTIQDLGNIGEFVGSIAVLLSLVYLAFQIRNSTEAARTSTYQSVVSDFGELNRAMASTPGLSSLFVKGMNDFLSLDPDEKARVSQLFFMIFHYFENMYYQNRKGYLENDVWIGWKRLMLTYYGCAGFQAWWLLRKDVFSSRFVEFLANERSDKPVASYFDITQMANPAA
ncbi:MAG: hypothetical protein OEW35_07730 [Gammaproteobacteria bacterium]|nr:hypothetical protein [Gammaproteobacteria bacterium]MDH4255927.1 hypothetical protein [Gammaproteobacteria bacterium]MDH5310916.1 hypothetical protein [Gammaproteobacteria bacterium]